MIKRTKMSLSSLVSQVLCRAIIYLSGEMQHHACEPQTGNWSPHWSRWPTVEDDVA